MRYVTTLTTRGRLSVTGFGLLGHLFKLAAGYVPGGSRRNLGWVRPHLASNRPEDDPLPLADAQTSGGLLVAGELTGHPVVGELVPRREHVIEVR